MSATFETGKFARYFSLSVGHSLEPAPVFKITGRTYEVQAYYIEDLNELGPVSFLILYLFIIIFNSYSSSFLFLFIHLKQLGHLWSEDKNISAL